MKKIVFILMTAILLTGGAVVVMQAPSYAQDYEYPPQPDDPYASPWVGPDTPWVYYNGDWFLNGILYYFYGPQYGWAPYYAYTPDYIVRPDTWYSPRWLGWYQTRPQYWVSFQRQYPYWRQHREGQHYSQQFFEQHHRGQGAEWQKGFQAHPVAASKTQGSKQVPAQVAPAEKQKPKQPQQTQQPAAVQQQQQPKQPQQTQQPHPAVQQQQPKQSQQTQQPHPAVQQQQQQQHPQPKGEAKEQEKQKE